MDVHKPKPWHGWREFLREILVIVLGVLIALAAEQAVEALHWRHEVAAAQEALKEPYAREIDNAAAVAAQSPCVTRRLAQLSSILDQASATGRLPRLGPIGHPPNKPWTVETWDALVASQTVTHLPKARMIAYTRIRQRTAYLSGLSDRQEDDWTVLDSMVGPGRRLSDVEAAQLRLALASAAAANREMTRVSGVLKDAVRQTGLIAAPVFSQTAAQAAREAPAAAICRPLG